MKDLKIRFGLFLAALVISAGCAQIGMSTPESFNEKAAVALVSVTQVRDTATQLLVAKKISADDAQNVQTSADVARAGIDTARVIHNSNPTAGNAKLDAVRASLTALLTYLNSRKQ